jgi:hypothetical protein
MNHGFLIVLQLAASYTLSKVDRIGPHPALQNKASFSLFQIITTIQ